jgi:hypothetical protein
VCVMFRDNKVSPRSDSDHGPSQQSPSPSRKQNGTSSSLSSKSVMNIQIESEESSSLLSKLDNKHIKEEFSSPAVFLGDGFVLFIGVAMFSLFDLLFEFSKFKYFINI